MAAPCIIIQGRKKAGIAFGNFRRSRPALIDKSFLKNYYREAGLL